MAEYRKCRRARAGETLTVDVDVEDSEGASDLVDDWDASESGGVTTCGPLLSDVVVESEVGGVEVPSM